MAHVPAAAREIAAECLGVRARLLSRVVSRVYDEALRPYGIKVSQVNLLTAISTRPGTSAHQLGPLLGLEKSTLSRNLGRMERSGWITQERGADGRERLLEATTEGTALLRRLLPAWRRAQKAVEKALGAGTASAVAAFAKRHWRQTAT